MQTCGNVYEYGTKPPNAQGRIMSNLTGQRFGMLTAIRPTDKRADHGSVVWECVCDCGKQKEVSANRLHRGKVRSCGCLSNPPVRNYIGERFGRLTVIEFLGRSNPASSMNYWKCRCDCGNETVVGQTELQNGETKSCGCYKKERLLKSLQLIDDTSVTLLEQTRKTIKSTNKSGYTGVSWDKRTRKWIARLPSKRSITGLDDMKIYRTRSKRGSAAKRCGISFWSGITWNSKAFRRHPSR